MAHLCVGFFALSGVLELVLPIADGEGTKTAWNAVGQALLHWLLAAGLWWRLLLCRVLAHIYCLAALVTYGIVLGLALAQAPIEFPPSVVVMSLFQVPSCAILLPWLRGGEARLLLSRRLRG
jgi:hypothetical protein